MAQNELLIHVFTEIPVWICLVTDFGFFVPKHHFKMDGTALTPLLGCFLNLSINHA
jgi:hypothetical protein